MSENRRGKARSRHGLGSDVPAHYMGDGYISTPPQNDLICDGGGTEDRFKYWEEHEDKLILLVNGDHGLLSDLAELILEHIDEKQNEGSGE